MDSQSHWYEWYCTGCFKRTRVRDNENVPDDQRCKQEKTLREREYKQRCRVAGCQHFSIHSDTL
eukprot:4857057-Karenia_brevis.AAC.1